MRRIRPSNREKGSSCSSNFAGGDSAPADRVGPDPTMPRKRTWQPPAEAGRILPRIELVISKASRRHLSRPRRVIAFGNELFNEAYGSRFVFFRCIAARRAFKPVSGPTRYAPGVTIRALSAGP